MQTTTDDEPPGEALPDVAHRIIARLFQRLCRGELTVWEFARFARCVLDEFTV